MGIKAHGKIKQDVDLRVEETHPPYLNTREDINLILSSCLLIHDVSAIQKKNQTFKISVLRRHTLFDTFRMKFYREDLFIIYINLL